MKQAGAATGRQVGAVNTLDKIAAADGCRSGIANRARIFNRGGRSGLGAAGASVDRSTVADGEVVQVDALNQVVVHQGGGGARGVGGAGRGRVGQYGATSDRAASTHGEVAGAGAKAAGGGNGDA